MNERPILFSGPMVRAILEGRKTMTRRVWRAQHIEENVRLLRQETVDAMPGMDGSKYMTLVSKCPYGRPGDLLWVRETWGQYREGGPVIGSDPIYRADWVSCPDTPPRWRPSIHMPRWASRLTLRVTDVRVERLQEISEEDAVAEGVPTGRGCLGPLRAFENLWDSLNAQRAPWASNPWVFVVSFERVT